MALILKEDDSFRTATRHFVHSLNSRLDVFDRDLENAKDLAEEHSSRKKLDEAYPEKFFGHHKESLRHIDEVAERAEASDMSPRYMALEVQKAVTTALMKLEAAAGDARGFNKQIDNLITDKLMELFSMASVTTFVQESSSRRTQRMQALLEESLTPSQFASVIGFHDFKLKDFHNSVVSRVCREYEASVEDGTDVAFNLDASCEAALDELTMNDFQEVLETIADRIFVNNDSYAPLCAEIRHVSDKLYDKSLNKVKDIVEDEIALLAA